MDILPKELLADLTQSQKSKVIAAVGKYRSPVDDGTSEFLFGGMDSTERVVTQTMILALENLNDVVEQTCFRFFESCYKGGFLTKDDLVLAIVETSEVLDRKGISFDTRTVKTFLDGVDIFELSREKFLRILDTGVSKK